VNSDCHSYSKNFGKSFAEIFSLTAKFFPSKCQKFHSKINGIYVANGALKFIFKHLKNGGQYANLKKAK
jgi:hypothetical protein